MPSWVRQVAEEYLNKDYKTIDLAQNLKNKTARNVNHLCLDVPIYNRLAALADICKPLTIHSFIINHYIKCLTMETMRGQ